MSQDAFVVDPSGREQLVRSIVSQPAPRQTSPEPPAPPIPASVSRVAAEPPIDKTQLARSLVLLVGGALIVASLLFPPWAYTFQTAGISQVRKPAGYGFVLAPPTPEHLENGDDVLFGIVLDWSRLTAQVAALALLTTGGWLFAGPVETLVSLRGRIGPAFRRATRAMWGDMGR